MKTKMYKENQNNLLLGLGPILWYIIVMALLFNTLRNNAEGCVIHDCPPCEHFIYEENRCGGCIDCSCNECNTNTTPASCQSKCKWEECKECKYDEQGNCLGCGSFCETGLSCCYGICYDPGYLCQECNETSRRPETCKGDSSKCCDPNNVCVKRCNQMGERCPRSKPAIQSTCPMANVDDPSCGPWTIGLTCDWEETVLHNNRAKCAPCSPECGIYADGEHCAKYEPITCDNKWILFMGWVCTCYKIPALSVPEYSGVHYDCP